MFKKFLLWAVGLLTLTVIALGAAAYWFIVLYPADEIGPENLKKLMGVESPVFYADGENKLGVIFEDSHRQYLPYAKIPQGFVKAIIAAEDHTFFSHYGVDFVGIMRAMIANLQAGRVVQGGSTLTQQAAKNLFKREGRSLKEKVKELLYALRLEAHYSKEKILEFYANQFYVSGNGLGLGVAAKYYFDKEPEELTLLENAFIAGSVKRPNYYNPFIKRDKASAQAARQRARERTAYVLGQMREMGSLTEQEYRQALDMEIPFKQGQMSFAVSTVMDVVREALAEPEVEEVLAANGVENVAASGIKIYTTVDKELQEAALNATRQELSRLSIRLMGYNQRALQQRYQKLATAREAIEEGAFLFGRVLAINKEGPTIEISLGSRSSNGVLTEVTGQIDHQGLSGVVEAQAKFEGQRWSEANRQQFQKLVDTIAVDDLVYVSVNAPDPTSGRYRLELHKYPEIQGALIAVQEGKIITMIGGNENRFFNRAMDAKRVMGSVVKPLVYSAALQLGWNAADLLSNQRNGFVYQGQEYFPRPDHQSPYQWVSISWAGVKSENLASVWLLYHLCDRLTPGQFKELTAKVGLGRGDDESYQHYVSLIRDQFGIMVTDQTIRRLAFDRAVELIGPDLLFDGKMVENDLLHQFNYQLEGVIAEDEKPREREAKRAAVARTFIDQQRYFRQLLAYKTQIEAGGEFEGQGMPTFTDQEAQPHLYSGAKGYLWASSPPGPEWRLMTRDEVVAASRAGQSLHPLQGAAPSTMTDGLEGGEFWDEISLNGILTASTFRQLSELIGQEFQRFKALPPYSAEVLYHVRDFRVLAGLRYLIALTREMGITSPLEPVLSFPLGSNVISLMEVARAYETMVTGENYRTGQPGADEALMIIDRIEDSEGHEIYRPQRVATRVFDPNTALCLGDILKNVVKYGTGRYARTHIRLHSKDPKRQEVLDGLNLEVPVLGKTGTANEFRNSSFAGYVPGVAADGSGLSLRHGYALAAYEGFDDNISMTRTSSHISGSAGALVLWSEIAEAIADDRAYADQLTLDPLVFSNEIEFALEYPELGQIEVGQTTIHGIASQMGDSAVLMPTAARNALQLGPSVVTFGQIMAGSELAPARNFKPFWGVQ